MASNLINKLETFCSEISCAQKLAGFGGERMVNSHSCAFDVNFFARNVRAEVP